MNQIYRFLQSATESLQENMGIVLSEQYMDSVDELCAIIISNFRGNKKFRGTKDRCFWSGKSHVSSPRDAK